MSVPLYFDHNVDRQLAVFLRAREFDVVTAAEDAAERFTDQAILTRATDLGRVIFTHNRLDFRRLPAGWMPTSRTPAGILVAAMRRQDLLPARLLAFHERETPETMANRLVSLHAYDRFIAEGQP